MSATSRRVRTTRATGQRWRPASVLGAAILAVGLLAGCGSDPEEPASGASPTAPTEEAPAGTDASAEDFPLADDLTATEPPIWSFPVDVEGWELSVFDRDGVNQLRRGEDALFTSFQLELTGADEMTDEEASRDYLAQWPPAMERGGAEMTDLQYGAETLASTTGSVEFLALEADYATPAGAFRSRYLARALAVPGGRVLVAVQYAAPASEFSDEEWELLTADLELRLAVS